MSTEINTRGMVRNVFSTFPSGNDAECLTKQTLLSGSGNLMNVSGGDTECVALADIGFKVYPCKSQTDKAPLGNDMLRFPLRNESHNNIWFSSNVSIVNLSDIYIEGIPPIEFTEKEIGLNEESLTLGFGVINRGDYLDFYCMEGIDAISDIHIVIPIVIDGTQYDIHIESI